MRTTRFGSDVPRWIATISMTCVGCGTRFPVTVWAGVSICRQPPQSLEKVAKRDCTQRRAAPMPRWSDLVSDKVWRVPKLTSLVIVACNSSALTWSVISRKPAGSLGGGVSAAAAVIVARLSEARKINACMRNSFVGMFMSGLECALAESPSTAYAAASNASMRSNHCCFCCASTNAAWIELCASCAISLRDKFSPRWTAM